MSKHTQAITTYREAHADFERTRKQRSQITFKALQLAGVPPVDVWHPAHDAGDLAVAEAEERLARASAQLDALDPDAAALREAVRTALTGARDKLAAIGDDPPEPGIADTQVARDLYASDCKQHAETCSANAARRAELRRKACKTLMSALSGEPGGEHFESRTRQAADTLERALNDTVDPPAPKPGRPCPETAEAMAIALAAHRETRDANARQRRDVERDLMNVVRALNAADLELRARNREASIPHAEIFAAARSGSERRNLDRLGTLEAINVQTLSMWLRGIGAAPTPGANAKLTELRDRLEKYRLISEALVKKEPKITFKGQTMWLDPTRSARAHMGRSQYEHDVSYGNEVAASAQQPAPSAAPKPAPSAAPPPAPSAAPPTAAAPAASPPRPRRGGLPRPF